MPVVGPGPVGRVRTPRNRGAQGVTAAPDRVAEGLAEIYRAHAADVSRWVRRLQGPHADVEDVLQDVFVIAHRRLAEFRGDSKITTWLYTITVRVVQERRRRDRLLRWLRLDRLVSLRRPNPPTPLEMVEHRRAAEVTYALLDKLPEAERTALILFEIEGCSGEEIASITGETTAAIWVRLHRARTRFRKAFRDWERRAEGAR